MRSVATYQVLIPISHDETGVLHPPEVLDDWQEDTATRFQGLTALGMVDGRWFDPVSTSLVKDQSLAFLLGVEDERRPELLEHIVRAAEAFGQKCIFLEERGRAFFVEPRVTPRQSLPVAYNTQPYAPAPLLVGEPAPRYRIDGLATEYRPDALKPWMESIKARIEAGDDFLAVYRDALGPSSPALRGFANGGASARHSASYRGVRAWVTDYGRRLGLMAAPGDPYMADEIGLVRDSAQVTYRAGGRSVEDMAERRVDAPSERTVSRLAAANALGWSLQEVEQAIQYGLLTGTRVRGALVVTESSVVSALRQ